jgi:serine protease AprX
MKRYVSKIMATPKDLSRRKPHHFDPGILIRSVIARPLLEQIEQADEASFDVIIDINLDFKLLPDRRHAGSETASSPLPDQRLAAKTLIRKYIEKAKKITGVTDSGQSLDEYKSALSNQYVFARLDGRVIKALVSIDQQEASKRAKKAKAAQAQAASDTGKSADRRSDSVSAAEASCFRTIHHIWPDFELRNCITHTLSTIKVDAARNSFAALGKGITWAVMDTGIDALHPHFKLHNNIDITSPYHADFTNSPDGQKPLQDDFGHGTHVAGIIAGEQSLKKGADKATLLAVSHELDVNGATVARKQALEAISGMAPQCKLISLKVLDEAGIGRASNVIAALAHVQAINGHGRDIKIHGINLSLSHPFDPKWFACGHSPLCVEVNRLVKSGVVVVVAAGNTGYGTLQTKEGVSDTCLDLTINDPGNAEYAITVGSTHRDSPHKYGTSYFSSKGPTGDGRCKPDLLAPGEKIISSAAPKSDLITRESDSDDCYYIENSGTSMAAPHVSGAIAAFLSIRSEFIGEAEKVKQIFTSTATDLNRDRYFQGAGLIDLMRAIQSV